MFAPDTYHYFGLLSPGAMLSGHKEIVTIENRYFRYEISKDGKNLHFTDKQSGTDYLKQDSVSWCAKLIADGKEYNITNVSLKGKL